MMTTQKFNELLRNISNDNCFAELYNEYYPYIINYGLIVFKNRNIAEDVAQDIFNYLLTHKITTEIRKPNVWLYTIVKHYFTKYKTNTVSLDDYPNIPTSINDYMQLEVRMAIEKLAPNEQEIIILKWYGGFSLKDIAILKKKTIGSVWKQHERILRKLKKLMSS